MHNQPTPNIRLGVALAIGATLLWSGNFIVARGIIHQVPPVTLAFFRWLTATLVLLPFALKDVVNEFACLRKHGTYLLITALSGITVFNTLVYVAGHYSPAINLALIGTTSAPVFSTILAAAFLKEKISMTRLAGMATCFAGILLLLSKGSWQTLQVFRFSAGDAWVLGGAFSFAIYTIQVRRKTKELSNLAFLWTIFSLGTLMLLPVYLWEKKSAPAVAWSPGLYAVILYLGAGASVVSYLIWNLAIGRLGAARTAIFGNLIPLFSTIEAVFILGEPILKIHWWSGLLILVGLVIANKTARSPAIAATPELRNSSNER